MDSDPELASKPPHKKKFFKKKKDDKRQRRDESRLNEMKIRVGNEFQNQRKQQIKDRLLYGLNPEQAQAKVETSDVTQPILLPLTTRQIGFGICETLQASRNYTNINYTADCYMKYRVYLAVFEVRLRSVLKDYTLSSRFVADQYVCSADANLESSVGSVTSAPTPIAEILEQIGILKVHDDLFYPVIARNYFNRNNVFIPLPENVMYSNLQLVVNALSNANTPLAYRQNFRNNSPLPGAVWDNDILVNVNDFWPPGYTNTQLQREIALVSATLASIQKQIPKMVSPLPSLPRPGTRSMLMSNETGDLRQVERQPNEALPDYYSRALPLGNVYSYWSRYAMTAAEKLHGQVCLLGEQSTTRGNLIPLYLIREEAVSSHFYSANYLAAYQVTYG